MLFITHNSNIPRVQSLAKPCSNNFPHLFHFCISDSETTDCVASMYFCALQCDYNIAVFLTVFCWPVLVTFSLRK